GMVGTCEDEVATPAPHASLSRHLPVECASRGWSFCPHSVRQTPIVEVCPEGLAAMVARQFETLPGEHLLACRGVGPRRINSTSPNAWGVAQAPTLVGPSGGPDAVKKQNLAVIGLVGVLALLGVALVWQPWKPSESLSTSSDTSTTAGGPSRPARLEVA